MFSWWRLLHNSGKSAINARSVTASVSARFSCLEERPEPFFLAFSRSLMNALSFFSASGRAFFFASFRSSEVLRHSAMLNSGSKPAVRSTGAPGIISGAGARRSSPSPKTGAAAKSRRSGCHTLASMMDLCDGHIAVPGSPKGLINHRADSRDTACVIDSHIEAPGAWPDNLAPIQRVNKCAGRWNPCARNRLQFRQGLAQDRVKFHCGARFATARVVIEHENARLLFREFEMFSVAGDGARRLGQGALRHKPGVGRFRYAIGQRLVRCCLRQYNKLVREADVNDPLVLDPRIVKRAPGRPGGCFRLRSQRARDQARCAPFRSSPWQTMTRPVEGCLSKTL